MASSITKAVEPPEPDPDPDPALQQLNNDLKSWMEFCHEHKLEEEDIKKICQPLTTRVHRAKLMKHFRLSIIIFGTVFLIWTLTYFEWVSWNLSAIGRMFLVNFLPFFDWQDLKADKCMVSNPLGTSTKTHADPLGTGAQFECPLCESIDEVEETDEIDPQFLHDRYVKLHNPVILYNAVVGWKSYNMTPPDVVSTALQDPHIGNSVPCHLSTNTFSGIGPLHRVLHDLQRFRRYFVHFQNCEFEATKGFRVLAPRPGFLGPEFSPVQYNWLLMSRNYNVTRFKAIQLREPVTLIGQVLGGNYFRLTPRRNCKVECPILDLKLKMGEGLVFSSLWNLEYRPKEDSENVAFILELH